MSDLVRIFDTETEGYYLGFEQDVDPSYETFTVLTPDTVGLSELCEFMDNYDKDIFAGQRIELPPINVSKILCLFLIPMVGEAQTKLLLWEIAQYGSLQQLASLQGHNLQGVFAHKIVDKLKLLKEKGVEYTVIDYLTDSENY